MSSFRSTERPPVPRAIGPFDKWLADPVTGAIVGIQNPNAGGKDTMIGPVFATLAQLQNPTPEMLEMTGAVFMLSTAPYSRYYSNGEALIGEGVETTYGTLSTIGGFATATVPTGALALVYTTLTVQEFAELTIQGTVRVGGTIPF